LEKLIRELKELAQNKISYESLGEFIFSYDFSSLEYKQHLPNIEDTNDYARNILMMDPIECVLLHWPNCVESGVHYHQGFYGYVIVLDGVGEDHVYIHKDNTLKDFKVTKCFPGGIIAEPDGVIHKITNSQTEL